MKCIYRVRLSRMKCTLGGCNFRGYIKLGFLRNLIETSFCNLNFLIYSWNSLE
jgi:hypothetical protein